MGPGGLSRTHKTWMCPDFSLAPSVLLTKVPQIGKEAGREAGGGGPLGSPRVPCPSLQPSLGTAEELHGSTRGAPGPVLACSRVMGVVLWGQACRVLPLSIWGHGPTALCPGARRASPQHGSAAWAARRTGSCGVGMKGSCRYGSCSALLNPAPRLSFFLFSFFFLRLPPFPFPPGFSPSGPALLSLYSFSCKVLHQAWIRKRSHKWQGAGPAARSKTSLSPLVAALGPSLCPPWGSACPHPARRHRGCPFDRDRGEGPQPDGLLVSLMRRETHLGMEGAGRKRF